MTTKPIIIDVREPEEYAAGHVDGAINMPPHELSRLGQHANELTGVPKETPIIVYCRSGSRSNVAMTMLIQAGYTNVTNGINQDHIETHLKNSH
ncbi:MAG TPA: rhodanese-like domain-containing protein [Candidatus Saccharimonadales bacterium]